MNFRRLIFLLLALTLGIGFLAAFTSSLDKPEAPVATASNDLNSGSIQLTWDAVDGADCYRIYRSEKRIGGYTQIKSTSSTAYTDTSADVCQTFYYLVKAVSENGTSSDPSNKISAARKLPRPDVALSSVSSSGKIKVSWKPVKDASSYQVYRSTDDSDWALVETTSSTSYTDIEAESGVKYYYRVKTISSQPDCDSAFSSINCKTCDLPRPVVTVTNTSFTGRVKLKWESIDSAIDYQIYRATEKTGSFKKIKSTTSTSFIDTTGNPGKLYYYKVKAISANSDANSAFSAIKSGKYVNADGPTLCAKLNSDGAPYLSWSAVSGATDYQIYRSMTRTGEYRLISTHTACNYTNRSAPNGVTLYYKISAINSSGKVLETSNIASVTTPPSENEILQTSYVAVPKLVLHEAPASSSDSIQIRYMEELMLGNAVISDEDSGWYRVFYQDKPMYLWMEKNLSVLTDTKSSSYTGKTPYQQQILELATDISENWNTTYVSGMAGEIANSSGDHGFNCSGLVKYVFNTVMQEFVPTYKLNASLRSLVSLDSIYNLGYPGEFCAQDVEYWDLQPGDVLFFSSRAGGTVSKEIGHCGIYLGNNEFVHSTSLWSDSVCIVPLAGVYKDTLRQIRRFLPKTVTPADTETTLSNAYKTCKVYAEMDSDSKVVATISSGETLTILFTNSGKWAYVQAQSGAEGFVQSKYLQ